MIARLWSARAIPAQAPAYTEHLKAHVLPATQAVEGYAGALLLEREDAGEIELMVITLWDSLDAIRGFAGADIEGAVVADEAAAVLTSFDDRVRHYEIAARDCL
jgi:heme-degrading monooxygenase HmoA